MAPLGVGPAPGGVGEGAWGRGRGLLVRLVRGEPDKKGLNTYDAKFAVLPAY